MENPPTATDLQIASLTGQVSALKMILAQLLSRYASEFGDDAEEFIMTITGTLASVSIDDEGDQEGAVAMANYAQLAEQIERIALSQL